VLTCFGSMTWWHFFGLGAVPVNFTSDKRSTFQTKGTAIVSIIVILLFIFYTTNYEIIPWIKTENFSIETRTVQVERENYSQLHDSFVENLNITLYHFPSYGNANDRLGAMIQWGVRCDIVNGTFSMKDCVANCTPNADIIYGSHRNEDRIQRNFIRLVSDGFTLSGPCILGSVGDESMVVSMNILIFNDYLAHIAFDISILTDSIDGFMKFRLERGSWILGPGISSKHAYVMQRTSLPHVNVYYHDAWWNNIQEIKTVWTNDMKPLITELAFENSEVRKFTLNFSIAPTMIEYHVRPENLFRVLARIGGLVTILGGIAFAMRYYNGIKFHRAYGESVELERFLRTVHFVEDMMAKNTISIHKSEDNIIDFIPCFTYEA